MSAATARRLSRSFITLELVLIAVMTTALSLTPGDRSKGANWAFLAIASVVSLLYAIVGSLIVSHDPRNTIGWIFSVDGLAAVIWGSLGATAVYLLKHDLNSGVGIGLAWISNFWAAVPVTIGFIFLLFPDGRAPSARWRALGWVMGVAGAIAVLALALTPDADLNNLADSGIHLANPIAIGTQPVMSTITGLAATITALLSASTVFAIRGRYKRGTPDERQQIRWLAAVGTIAAALFGLLFVIALVPIPRVTNVFPVVLLLFVLTLALGIPAACTVAILKYRLYDLDVVIKKAAVALLITLVLAAFGVGLAALLGQSALWEGTPRLVTLAIGIVGGVLLLPIVRAARRIARRVVYGKRATPYDVLARFAGRVGGSYDAEDVLTRMAAILGEATGAEAARVWLRIGSSFVPEGAWPVEAERVLAIAGPGDSVPDLGADATVEVRDRGELMGALTLDMPAPDPMTPAKDRLLADLAAQAGLVLRNSRLIEELRASRQRLVAAQDEERRKIERNLHDGAQQQLVALAVQLKLARQLVDRDAEKAGAMLDTLQGAAGAALDDLRDLARGIYPPLLADKGLAAAIEAQARKAAVPTTVDAADLGRYPQDVESAVYFSVLEALNNVAKYASASRAVVALSQTDGTLSFEVRDDGSGFDAAAKAYGTGLQGMRDRLDAIGGGLRVDSAPGAGTTITGHVPVAAKGSTS